MAAGMSPVAAAAFMIVAAASMSFWVLVIVMIALYIWIISEVSRQEIFYSLIRLSRDSSVELDSGFFKGALRSRSYSAADQNIGI